MSMKLSKVLRTFDLFHINQTYFLPKFHCSMPANCFLYVAFDKKPLINCAHLRNYSSNIDWRRQYNQRLYVKRVFFSDQVSHQIVSSKTCSDQIDVRIWVIIGNSSKCSFQLSIFHCSERYWARHFIVDPSTIQANAAVSLLRSWFHQLLDIIHLASTSQAVHNEQNWRIRLRCHWGKPIKRDVTSIIEEYFFPFELKRKKGLTNVIHRLKQGMGKIGCRLIGAAVGLASRFWLQNGLLASKKLSKVLYLHSFYLIIQITVQTVFNELEYRLYFYLITTKVYRTLSYIKPQ